MYLTNEYAADELKSMCVEVMKDRIDANLLLWTLELAIDCNSNELHAICLKQIKKNWLQAITSDWFPRMQHKALEDILRINCSKRNEKILFDGCIDWAKRICDEDEELDANSPRDWRKVLNEYLDLIHFDKMTKEEFKSLKGFEVLSSSEISTTITKIDNCKKFTLK